MSSSILACGRFKLDMSRPKIMAIINVTADSFSGDGCPDLGSALLAAERAVKEGAEILDIGGESSRPGATMVSEQQELDRVVPLVEALAPLNIPLSIDTVKPAVMRESIRAGADLINDIASFRAPGALEAVCGSSAAWSVMHMQGEPGTMQLAPSYRDVVAEVRSFLDERVRVLLDNGVSRQRIVVDPGFGFGKTLEHNYELMAHLEEFHIFELPVLVGVSRKSMIYKLLGGTPQDSLNGTTVLDTVALMKGAHILRVHDVREAVEAVRITEKLKIESGYDK